jgi:hypothetical protein
MCLQRWVKQSEAYIQLTHFFEHSYFAAAGLLPLSNALESLATIYVPGGICGKTRYSWQRGKKTPRPKPVVLITFISYARIGRLSSFLRFKMLE